MAATQTSKIQAPAHQAGVRKGEEVSRNGRNGNGRTSRDATSINSNKRAPIDPSMPEMPPA